MRRGWPATEGADGRRLDRRPPADHGRWRAVPSALDCRDVPARWTCKAIVIGDSDERLEQMRERVETHMNYQLLEEDEEYF
jgi:hypothetical protein